MIRPVFAASLRTAGDAHDRDVDNAGAGAFLMPRRCGHVGVNEMTGEDFGLSAPDLFEEALDSTLALAVRPDFCGCPAAQTKLAALPDQQYYSPLTPPRQAWCFALPQDWLGNSLAPSCLA
jgi:hypothetical protein